MRTSDVFKLFSPGNKVSILMKVTFFILFQTQKSKRRCSAIFSRYQIPFQKWIVQNISLFVHHDRKDIGKMPRNGASIFSFCYRAMTKKTVIRFFVWKSSLFNIFKKTFCQKFPNLVTEVFPKNFFEKNFKMHFFFALITKILSLLNFM